MRIVLNKAIVSNSYISCSYSAFLAVKPVCMHHHHQHHHRLSSVFHAMNSHQHNAGVTPWYKTELLLFEDLCEQSNVYELPSTTAVKLSELENHIQKMDASEGLQHQFSVRQYQTTVNKKKTSFAKNICYRIGRMKHLACAKSFKQ